MSAAPRMPRRRWAALLALAAVLPAEAPAQPPPPGTVTGTVTADRGVPLVEAEVRLLGTDHRALTGADGRFVLHGIAPGGYMLLARRIGHDYSYAAVNVASGGTVQVQFELATAAYLLPDVETRDGLPIRVADLERRVARGRSIIIPAGEISRFPTIGTALQFLVPARYALPGNRPLDVGPLGRNCLLVGMNGSLPMDATPRLRLAAGVAGLDPGSLEGTTLREELLRYSPHQVEALEFIPPEQAEAEFPGQVGVGCAVLQVWW